MRTHVAEARGSRTLTGLFDAALSLLQQDIAEYGFPALLWAVAAAIGALVLWIGGGIVGLSLIAPVVFIIALLTYANTSAAIRRVQDNLEPDSVRALAAVLTRLPALLATATLPLAVTFGAVFGALAIDEYVGSELATTFAMAIIAAAAMPPLQRALWVPAMFARDATFQQATARGTEAMRTSGAFVGVAFAIALIPAGLMALFALTSGFHIIATALAAFVYVASMPLLAAIAALVLEQAAPEVAATAGTRAKPRAKDRTHAAVQERLTRRMR